MSQEIHAGEGSPKVKRRRWSMGLLACLVLIVAAGAGAGLKWWQANHKPKTAIDTVLNAQNMTYGKNADPKAAEAEIDKALAGGNLSKQDSYYLYFQKAVFYDNSKNYKQALEYYKQAASFVENDNIYEAMATAARQLGNKDQAITYYQRAIELIPKDDPIAGATKDRLQRQIDGLNGKPVEGPPASLKR